MANLEDGTNTENVVYEEQLENLPGNIHLEAEDYIYMEDLNGPGDNELTVGERDVCFETTGPDSYIKFEDADDSIETIGDITMIAGSGGIDIGNLVTGAKNPHVVAGAIRLSTSDGGDIETGYLNTFGGSEASVTVIASGDVRIYGDTPHGAVVARTHSVPKNVLSEEASSQACLQSLNGSVTIDGYVVSWAHSKKDSYAEAHIHAVEDVTVNTRNGRIEGWADTVGDGVAEAVVKVHAGGEISITGNGADPTVRARAKLSGAPPADVKSFGDEEVKEDFSGEDDEAHAMIEIDADYECDCPGCGDTDTGMDTAAPTISCPNDITVEATGPDGAVVVFAATATDLCDPAPDVNMSLPSGSTFALGTTEVTCTATDSSGNSSSCSFLVTVTEPPAIEPIEVSMRFTPKALNLCSRGRWVKAHLVFPAGFTATDVDTKSPAILELLGIEVASERVKVLGNKKGRAKVRIAFDRSAFCGIVPDADFAVVTVTGSLTTGQQFFGTDRVKMVSSNSKRKGRPS
jgi:hypothetical protein